MTNTDKPSWSPQAADLGATHQRCRNAPAPLKSPDTSPSVIQVRDLSASFGAKRIFENISFDIPAHGVVGLLGPSGAGKSTLLRCLNRLVEFSPGFRLTGDIRFHGSNILNRSVDADQLRARIGMIFQQPVVFPTNIRANVLFGVRRLRKLDRSESDTLVETSLRQAALWDEVKDRLRAPGQILSIGQQQRLCLARSLATDPEVILMDEPTSALDPDATRSIEDLILDLRRTRSLVLVTHNPAQAKRVCSRIVELRASAGAMPSHAAALTPPSS